MTELEQKLFDALARIYNADKSDNNGMFNGEAVLCREYALEAEAVLTEAGGQTTPSGYFKTRLMIDLEKRRASEQ